MHARVSSGASALLGKYIVSCSQSAFSGKQRGTTLSQWTLLQRLVFGERKNMYSANIKFSGGYHKVGRVAWYLDKILNFCC